MKFRTLLMLMIATSAYATASMSQQIFKWTDEDGQVHYSESVPEGVEEYDMVTVAPAPTAPPARLPAQAESTAPELAPKPPTPAIPAATPEPVSAMSLEELDQQCDAARERAIAPLRQAAIEECKASPRQDPAYCERFYADYGEAGRTVTGTIRPRMFDDLPECVTAMEERNRRQRK